jgi:hypothetical protein
VFEKAKTDKTEVYKTAIDPIKMLSLYDVNEVTQNPRIVLPKNPFHFRKTDLI